MPSVTLGIGFCKLHVFCICMTRDMEARSATCLDALLLDYTSRAPPHRRLLVHSIQPRHHRLIHLDQ